MLLVVGAGLSGAVLARQLAEHGYAVTVADSRAHLAGNCHTMRDPESGILEHLYGPHIFHTDNVEVWNYINRFGELVPYRHQVYATVGNDVFLLPINLHTINQFFRTNLNPREARDFLRTLTLGVEVSESFEAAALGTLGRELYEAFFYGYTMKQWGRDPRDLPASVFGRLPVRFNYDSNYFFHRFQGIPRHGYTEIVAKMLDHPLITVVLGEKISRDSVTSHYRHVFWTGPIDEYFGGSAGSLEYRTLRFEREVVHGDFQGCAVMNYPSLDVSHTRITEHKYFAPWESYETTIIYREYSDEHKFGDVPYYPVRLREDKKTLKHYVGMAGNDKRTSFLGRLGTYRYLDMDVAVREAIEAAELSIRCLERDELLPPFFNPPA